MDWTLTILSHFNTIPYQLPNGSFTVLAAFYLSDRTSGEMKLLSMATGTKCLPVKEYSQGGDVVHDLHAEIVARRGVKRWLLRELGKERSDWLVRGEEDCWKMKEGVEMNMYVSELPCGEASTLAISRAQALLDPEMAAIKANSISSLLDPTMEGKVTKAARGRDGYELLNRVRTKPGRGDAPPTNAMSCSDKICLWTVTGVQGALAISLGLQPIYLSSITIGNVIGFEHLYGDTESIHQDCERAFFARLGDFECTGYQVYPPRIAFTPHRFSHSRVNNSTNLSSTNEALCWIADEPFGKGYEVLVNGIRRGTSPKHRSNPALRPRISKASFLVLYRSVSSIIYPTRQPFVNYREAKHCQRTDKYHSAKARLREGGPLHGWIICDTELEMFNAE